MFLQTTHRDFIKLASEVIKGFFSKDYSLTDGVVKVANREELNPKEVKRLVEKTNTNAVVSLLKTSEDRKKEIDLAKYEDVIDQTHLSEEGTSVKEASDTSDTDSDIAINSINNFNLPKTRKQNQFKKIASYYDDLVTEFNKEAEAREDFTDFHKYLRDKSKLDLVKVAQEQLKTTIVDTMDKYVSEFSSYYAPDFSKFASETYTVFGNKAKPVLAEIAKNLSKDAEFTKVAHVIDDTSESMQEFDELLKNIEKLAASVQEEVTLRGNIDGYNKNRS